MGWLLSPLEAKRGPKHKLPSDTRQGALVGAFVGLISGIVTATYAYFMVLPFVWSALTARMIESPEALVALSTIWNTFMIVVVVGVPIIDAIMGAVLGVLFVVFRKKLPGSTIIRKSVAFSLILIAIYVLIGLRSYFSPNRISILDKATLATFHSMQVASHALILIEFPLLGCLFGYLLARRLGHK